jgi:DNA-binding SARP family transcriptional activator
VSRRYRSRRYRPGPPNSAEQHPSWWLWPDTSNERPTGPLNTAFSRLRRLITHATENTITDLVETTGDGRCCLNPALVQVDYWQLLHVLELGDSTTATPTDRAHAYQHALTHYHGELAENIDAEWIETHRQDTLGRTLKTATKLANDLTKNNNPQHALAVLEQARTFDPLSEPIYQKIILTHHQLGQPDAAIHTLQLLTRKLAQINTEPLPLTTKLATNPPPAATSR